jgi:hypothetical protein
VLIGHLAISRRSACIEPAYKTEKWKTGRIAALIDCASESVWAKSRQRGRGSSVMPYTVKQKSNDGFGTLSILAPDSREALEAAKAMIDRGAEGVEILDNEGRSCDLPEQE